MVNLPELVEDLARARLERSELVILCGGLRAPHLSVVVVGVVVGGGYVRGAVALLLLGRVEILVTGLEHKHGARGVSQESGATSDCVVRVTPCPRM